MNCYFKTLIRLVAVVVFAVSSANAFAAGCRFWYEINFADGAKGCLTDYPIAQMRPRLSLGSLAHILPGYSYTVIAVTSKDAMCPLVVGLGSIPKAGAYLNASDPVKTAAATYAVRNCGSSLTGKTRSTGGPCGCEVAIVDGTSPLTKSAFEAMVLPTKDNPPANVTVAPATAPVIAPSANRLDAIYQESPPSQPVQQAGKPVSTGQTQSQIAAAAGSSKDSGSPRPTARALVIGNSNYDRFGKLTNPKNDAAAIADKFRSLGVGVELLLDANRATLVNALNSFQYNARGKDVNILYYAGHSAQINGVNYLIPTDMQMESVVASYVRMNAIAMNDVIDNMPAKVKVIFMEACRENPVSKSVSSAGLAPVSASLGAFVVYANKNCASIEEKARNSVFTAAMLQNMDAPQDIGVVLRKVRQAVLTQSTNGQEPWDSGTLVGDELVLSRLSR